MVLFEGAVGGVRVVGNAVGRPSTNAGWFGFFV